VVLTIKAGLRVEKLLQPHDPQHLHLPHAVLRKSHLTVALVHSKKRLANTDILNCVRFGGADVNLETGNTGIQSAAANVMHDDALDTTWQQKLLRFRAGVVLKTQTAAAQNA